MLWVCKVFSTIREIERTSNHVRTTRREKTAYPIPKTCGKRTSEPPIQFYFSTCYCIQNYDNCKVRNSMLQNEKISREIENRWAKQIVNGRKSNAQ